MTDDQLQQAIFEYGFEDSREIRMLCEDVRRQTESRCFGLIGHAINAGYGRKLEPQRLDSLIFADRIGAIEINYDRCALDDLTKRGP